MRKWGWMAAGGLLLAVAVGVVPAAPAGPLRVAFLGPLSGPFAFWGTNARDGMRMAVEELTAAGGVLGRPVELVERDDRNNPAEAISLFRSLAEREGIVAAAGTISSDIGTALAREADQLQVPVFLVRAGAHTILKKTSRTGLAALTPNTITDLRQLRAELEQVRLRGYALDIEEAVLELCCVAAPIRDHRGEVVAAMSLSVPAYRFHRQKDELRRAIVAACREVSSRLGYTAYEELQRRRSASAQ